MFENSSETVFVKHEKKNEKGEVIKTYMYEGKVTDGNLSFTNPHGFSTFTITDQNPLATITDENDVTTGYLTLEAALADVDPGDSATITITEDGAGAIKKDGATGTVPNGAEVTLKDANGNPLTSDVTDRITLKDSEGNVLTPGDGGTYTSEVSSATVTYTITISNTAGASVTVTANGSPVGEVDGVYTVNAGASISITISIATQSGGGGSGSGNGNGGGGGGSPASNATVASTANGKATISPTSPKAGDKVTVTTTPNSGYKATGVTVKDKNGNTIAVTDNGDGTYSFTMPASNALPVTITPTFEKEETPSTGKFVDVPATAYYADAVAWAVEKGITNGTSANTFSPEASCTRAQMVTFLWRAAGMPEPTTTTTKFTDLGATDSYYKAVLWAVEQGITNGTGENTFSPNATVTRAQVVTFLYRYEKASAGTDNPFTDVASDAWYAAAVTWAVENEITNGTGNNQFSPNNDCTRGQIVTFLYRDMAE